MLFRSIYSPVLVSIRILSPVLINSGTLISAPVSSVAGFVALVAVSPLKPGSVSVTSSSTKNGGSSPQKLSLFDRNQNGREAGGGRGENQGGGGILKKKKHYSLYLAPSS